MTGPQPTVRTVAASARLGELIDEYREGDEPQVLVPLNQPALAKRWGISNGSVQDFLRRHERGGVIVSTSPLILNAPSRPSPPQLRLVTTHESTTEPTEPSGQAITSDLREGCLELMIEAAHQGNIDLAHALKEAMLHHLQPKAERSSTATPPPRGFSGVEEPAKTRENPRGTARTRDQEEELEEKIFFSSSIEPAKTREEPRKPANHEHGLLQQATAAVGSAALPKRTFAVVKKRLTGRSASVDGEYTPAWERSTWARTAPWTESDVGSLNRFWTQTGIAEELTPDAIAALQLWTPDLAANAIAILSGRTDTRSYSARIMDASVWGYHGFFPPTSQHEQRRRKPTSDRLAELATRLAEFDEQTLLLHLQASSDDVEDLQTRVGLALHLGLVSAEDLETLPFIPWSLPELHRHAADTAASAQGTNQ